jgi:hypothetical protein
MTSCTRRTTLILVMLTALLCMIVAGRPNVALAADNLVSLTEGSQTSCVGDSITLTAETNFGSDFDPELVTNGVATGHHFTFSGYAPNRDPIYTITVASPSGSSNITQTFQALQNGIYSNTVQHTWLAPSVSLAESSTSSEVGTSVTLTASLTCDPMSPVHFEVTGPGSANAPQDAPVASGRASATYSSTSPGTDSITASTTTGDPDHPCCITSNTVSHEWTAPAVNLAMSTTSGSSCLGQSMNVTATVTKDGTPLAGGAVQFSITMPGAPDLSPTRTSGADGGAAISYTRSGVGTDTVTAQVSVAGATPNPARSGPRFIRWINCANRGPGGGGSTSPSVPPTRPTSGSSAPTSSTPGHGSRTTGGTASTDNSHHAGTSTGSENLTVRDNTTIAGAEDMVTGAGCSPGTLVELTLDARPISSTTTDARGQFEIPFTVPSAAIGRHALTATCNGIVLTTPLDYVLTASNGGASRAGAATIGAILVFFVLLALQILRPTGGRHI